MIGTKHGAEATGSRSCQLSAFSDQPETFGTLWLKTES